MFYNVYLFQYPAKPTPKVVASFLYGIVLYGRWYLPNLTGITAMKKHHQLINLLVIK